MKGSKRLYETTVELLTENDYRVVYVAHHTIEDYNATYNVMLEGKHVTTNASKELGVPLGEIWISEMWRPYEKFILFHELREIHHRASGVPKDEAHEKAAREADSIWRNDPSYRKMIEDVSRSDVQTAKKRRCR